MRYGFFTEVINVEEKFKTVRVKMVDGKPEEEQESIGWFVRIADSSALYFGKEKPELQKGDKIKFTVEKVEWPPNG